MSAPDTAAPGKIESEARAKSADEKDRPANN